MNETESSKNKMHCSVGPLLITNVANKKRERESGPTGEEHSFFGPAAQHATARPAGRVFKSICREEGKEGRERKR